MRKIWIILIAIIAVFLFLVFSETPVEIIRPVLHKDTVNKYCGEYKLDPLFVTAIIKVESNFMRNARSKKGAIGLMQIMPATARELAAELGYSSFDDEHLRIPDTNIELGMYYISKLNNEFNDNKILVLASYNAGLGNVFSWLAEVDRVTFQIDDIPFTETREYVTKVLRLYKWLKEIQKLKSLIRSKVG